MSSMTEPFSYHERVGKVRAHFALSQTAIAERLGLSLRGYQNYERGEREIPVALVHALYEQFRVDPVWLLTGEGTMMLAEDLRKRLDQPLLDRVVEAVEQFEAGLKKPLSVEHKSRLIGLLYEKSQLLSEVAGETLSKAKLRTLLKLVA
ncbi:MAG: helix-turn-helix domain-containing protein [Acidiferrobacterales bacterium]